MPPQIRETGHSAAGSEVTGENGDKKAKKFGKRVSRHRSTSSAADEHTKRDVVRIDDPRVRRTPDHRNRYPKIVVRLGDVIKNADKAVIARIGGETTGKVTESKETVQEVSDPVEQPRSPERARPTGIPTPDLIKATELLKKRDIGNRYLADAAGYAKQIIVAADTSRFSMSRAKDIEPVVTGLAEFAVNTGDDQLAEYMFRRLPPAKRWLLYAIADDTTRISAAQLAQWRLDLETGEETAASNNDAEVNAARFLALTEREIHNYQTTTDSRLKKESLKRVRELKKKFIGVVLEPYNGGSDAYDRSLFWGKDREYKARLSMTFARAGFWKEAEELDPKWRKARYWRHDRNGGRFKHLAYQAVAGDLSELDLLRLRREGTTGKVLRWIDAKQNGLLVGQPDVKGRTVEERDLLEALVPEMVASLNLGFYDQYSELELTLARGDFQEAESKYSHRTKAEVDSTDGLRFALMMAKHGFDVKAAAAGHKVYTDAVIDELKPIEGYVDEKLRGGQEPNREALRDWMTEIYEKIRHLKNPQDALLIQARLARLYQRILPEADDNRYLIGDLQKQWTGFELQEGMRSQLPVLSESILGLGMQFIRRWKEGGYVGYEPVPLITDPQTGQTSDFITTDTYEPESEIRFWKQAEMELNGLLGEERYRVDIKDETKKEKESGRLQRRIIVHSIRSQYGLRSEIRSAKSHLSLNRRLHTMPDLSANLAVLMAPVIQADPENR